MNCHYIKAQLQWIGETTAAAGERLSSGGSTGLEEQLCAMESAVSRIRDEIGRREPWAEQYRAQAMRYHTLADQTDSRAREALYRRLERGYLVLADLARNMQQVQGFCMSVEQACASNSIA
jgi:hypothetical protein